MKNRRQFVVFTLDEQSYALCLSVVERVVRVVEVTPLPHVPEIVLGVVNVQGRPVPVIDIRRRFRLPEKEIKLTDQLIITQTKKRPLALVVDSVSGVIECSPEEVTAADDILPQMECVEGVVKLKNGMIFIHDLDRFLSLEEGEKLDEAMKRGENDGIGKEEAAEGDG